MPFPGATTFPGSAVYPGLGGPAGDHPQVTASVRKRRVEATILETIPRESTELLALDVRVDGAPTSVYETSVVLDPARPASWVAAVVDGDRSGPVITGLASGLYGVWVRVGGVVVVEAGWVWVS